MRTEHKKNKMQNLTLCLTYRLYIRHGYPIRPTAEGEDRNIKRRERMRFIGLFAHQVGLSCLCDPSVKGEGLEGGILLVSKGA